MRIFSFFHWLSSPLQWVRFISSNFRIAPLPSKRFCLFAVCAAYGRNPVGLKCWFDILLEFRSCFFSVAMTHRRLADKWQFFYGSCLQSRHVSHCWSLIRLFCPLNESDLVDLRTIRHMLSPEIWSTSKKFRLPLTAPRKRYLRGNSSQCKLLFNALIDRCEWRRANVQVSLT